MIRVWPLNQHFANSTRNTTSLKAKVKHPLETTQEKVLTKTPNNNHNFIPGVITNIINFVLCIFGLGKNTNKSAELNNTSFEKAQEEFKNTSEELQALETIEGILDWDLQTLMPAANSDYRAWQMSFITRKYYDTLISDTTCSLLDFLLKEENFKRLNKTEQVLLKYIKRQHDNERKVPISLAEEFTEIVAKAHSVWIEAKETNNFNLFAPYLKKIINLHKQMAVCRGYKGSPYNAVLNLYDYGMTTKELDEIFLKLKKELSPIIKKIMTSKVKTDNSFINKKQGEGELSEEELIELSYNLLETIGVDLSRGRFEKSAHPFTNTNGENDIGITSCLKGLWDAISAATHEGGHALYAQGIDTSLSKTLLYECSSLSIDESQSRLYEEIIGKSLSFWKFYFPKLKEKYPKRLEGITLDDFYRAINKVEVLPIRNISDEVTYNLHVIVRYEIEKDLIEGKLEVKDVPKAWNMKMQEHLGITPKNDSEGCLQDIHWATGDVGYFPSYTLGNLYAAQIYNTAKKEMPNLESEIEKGNLILLKEWLREKIHKYGRTETPDEITRRVTGEPLNVDYFINYIKEKYSKIYNIEL